MQKFSLTLEQLIQSHMATGRYASEDELLIDALRFLREKDEEFQPIEEGIASFERGEAGIDLEEAFDRLIARKDIPPEA